MRGETLKGHLDLLLLAVLQHEALHGYGVIQRLHERSAGAFALPEGTVYPALRRLEQNKLVRSRWQIVAGRRRCVYALTTAGKRALADEMAGWEGFQAAMSLVLEAPA